MKRAEQAMARKRTRRLLTPGTYWNYERATARRVRVVVGDAPKGGWCEGLTGTARDAVEVLYDEQDPFYLDNEDGSGWRKVTEGRGGPEWPHSSLPVKRVLRYL
jgi:hypothetical protein